MKNVDIPSEISSLQCSWVKKLFDRNFYKWKIIPLFLIDWYKNLEKNFKFHGSLNIPQYLIKKMYQNFTEKFCWIGTSFYLTILLYH